MKESAVWSYLVIQPLSYGNRYLNTHTVRLVARFKLGDLPSNGISMKKISVSVKLLVLKYCNKKFLQENTLPNAIVEY
jgi:hypothetical protein